MLNDAVGFSEIYIVCGRIDLRYGIDSLAGVLRYLGIENPATAGTLYLFCGRRSDRIKGLVWEGDGFLLLYCVQKDIFQYCMTICTNICIDVM